MNRDWRNPQVRQFSDCCSADYGPCRPVNQLYNNQKINKLEDFISRWSWTHDSWYMRSLYLNRSTFRATALHPAQTLNSEVIYGLISSAKAKDAGNERLLSGLQGVLKKIKVKDSSLEDDIFVPISSAQNFRQRNQRGPSSKMETVSPFNWCVICAVIDDEMNNFFMGPKSAVQKPKHRLTCSFLHPLVRTEKPGA